MQTADRGQNYKWHISVQNIIEQAEEAKQQQEELKAESPQSESQQSDTSSSESDEDDYTELDDRIGFIGAGQVCPSHCTWPAEPVASYMSILPCKIFGNAWLYKLYRSAEPQPPYFWALRWIENGKMGDQYRENGMKRNQMGNKWFVRDRANLFFECEQ